GVLRAQRAVPRSRPLGAAGERAAPGEEGTAPARSRGGARARGPRAADRLRGAVGGRPRGPVAEGGGLPARPAWQAAGPARGEADLGVPADGPLGVLLWRFDPDRAAQSPPRSAHLLQMLDQLLARPAGLRQRPVDPDGGR